MHHQTCPPVPQQELASTQQELARTKSALTKAQGENESLVALLKWYNLVDRKEFGVGAAAPIDDADALASEQAPPAISPAESVA